MFCTIYFADICTFIGNMPPPPVDDDEEMMHEVAAGQGPRVQILGGMRHKPDTIFKLDLGDRLSALLTEVGFFPILMQYIKEYPMI